MPRPGGRTKESSARGVASVLKSDRTFRCGFRMASCGARPPRRTRSKATTSTAIGGTPSRWAAAPPVRAACDSWHRWADDIALMQRARPECLPVVGRVGAHRARARPLRPAGARHLPTPARSAESSPVSSRWSHSTTSPARTGWPTAAAGANPDVIQRLAQYADRVGRVVRLTWSSWWVSINEPSILGLKGYIEGTWPPHRPMRSARLRAPAAATPRARTSWPVRRSRRSADPTPRSAWPSRSGRCSRSQLEPARPGSSPRSATGYGRAASLRRSLSALDWIGVNYYSRTLVGWPWPEVAQQTGNRRTDFGWEIYPRSACTTCCGESDATASQW